MAQVVRPDQPVSIELVSTQHVEDGVPVDALTTVADLAAWIRANTGRLPVEPRRDDASLTALRSLRDALHRLFAAAVRGATPDDDDVELINAASRAASEHLELVWRARGRPQAITIRAADPLTVLLGALARDGVEVLAGVHGELHACGAPSCVLFFVPTHPRQAWCSAACGNRARVARHYQRSKGERGQL